MSKKSKEEILKKAMSVQYCGGTRFDYLDDGELPLIYKAMEVYANHKKMSELTLEQKREIFNEMLEDQPVETVGALAVLKIAEMGISAQCGEISLSITPTIKDKQYKCKMLVTWDELNGDTNHD